MDPPALRPAHRPRVLRRVPMLHVLRHYLPLRKALLVLSETVLITLVVMAGMSSHLWEVTEELQRDLAYQTLSPKDARWHALLASILVAILAQITISFNELYDFRVSGSRYDRAARFLGSAGTAVLLVTAVVGLLRLWEVRRVLDFPGLPFAQTVALLTISLILAFTLLYLWRNLFHAILRRASFRERILILGNGRLAERTATELAGRTDSGYEIIGMVRTLDSGTDRRRSDRRRGDPPPPPRTGNPWFEATTRESPALVLAEDGSIRTVAKPRRLILQTEIPLPPAEEDHGPEGSRAVETAEDAAIEVPTTELDESIFEFATRNRVDEIIVAFEERRGSLPTEDLLRCRMEGIAVFEAEAFYERLTGKIPAEAMRPSYLIFNPGFMQHPLAQIAKRVADLCMAAIGLLLLWPVMLLTAIAIRLDSDGPILFRQERTGAHGRPFTLMKFRSMRVDAEKETGPVWAQENDPRTTRVGLFIRRTRLDELPQLFNVLGGSMSMVGPRPERPTFVEELAQTLPYYNQRHIVKPGITGWAQINYPYGNTVEDALQKLQYDLFYIKYQSIVLDLSIVFNTVKTVVLRKGT